MIVTENIVNTKENNAAAKKYIVWPVEWNSWCCAI